MCFVVYFDTVKRLRNWSYPLVKVQHYLMCHQSTPRHWHLCVKGGPIHSFAYFASVQLGHRSACSTPQSAFHARSGKKNKIKWWMRSIKIYSLTDTIFTIIFNISSVVVRTSYWMPFHISRLSTFLRNQRCWWHFIVRANVWDISLACCPDTGMFSKIV